MWSSIKFLGKEILLSESNASTLPFPYSFDYIDIMNAPTIVYS